jgi:hypothetical protein
MVIAHSNIAVHFGSNGRCRLVQTKLERFDILDQRTPLSAPVILGCIMLGGMVVNNGIVLIDFMNVLRRSGVGLRDAVFQASAARFRPIVMSNMTSVLGVLPLAAGLTEGSELTSPMAVVSAAAIEGAKADAAARQEMNAELVGMVRLLAEKAAASQGVPMASGNPAVREASTGGRDGAVPVNVVLGPDGRRYKMLMRNGVVLIAPVDDEGTAENP